MDIYQANENQNATTTEDQQPRKPARGQLQLQSDRLGTSDEKLDWEELEAVVGGLGSQVYAFYI